MSLQKPEAILPTAKSSSRQIEIQQASVSSQAPPSQAAVSKPTDVRLARLISRILHPFLIAPLSILVILYLDTGNFLAALGWAGLCAAFVVAPASLYLRKKLKEKKFTDADVSVREHRHGFYVFGASSMVICFAVLLWLDAPQVLIAFFAAALLAVVAAAVVTRFWTKVSIHAGVMAGATVAIAFYSLPLALVLALCTLLVSWARLVLKRHTAIQAVVAWGVAFVCVAGAFGVMLG